MPLFDAQCQKCKTKCEIVAPRGSGISIPCSCGGVYSVVWLKPPGMAPDISPYYDVQLGVQINSRQHRDSILKEKGLVALGPDEVRRTESQGHSPEPQWDSEEFQRIAAECWRQTVNHEIPPVELEPLPDYATESMVVDAADAKIPA